MAVPGEEAEPKRIRVEIDGEEFNLRGAASADHVSQLARVVDAAIREVRRAQPNLPRHRAAILVAINLADELQALRRENAELIEVLEEAR